jgi:hypothetical protein
MILQTRRRPCHVTLLLLLRYNTLPLSPRSRFTWPCCGSHRLRSHLRWHGVSLDQELFRTWHTNGMGYTFASLGTLIGDPVSGAAQRPISDVQLGFQGTLIFTGAIMLPSVFAMLVARYQRIGMRLGGKV